MATLARPVLTEYVRTPVNVRRLEIGDVATLPRTDQVVRVISGCAWITLNRDDLVVQSGERVTLYPGKYAPVISAVGNSQLVYEIIT
ncbi:MAG: hypothetical protein HZC41_11665 [Chloroflexi bacterium]|nr:hypothetical protein [Chloroflexota bacterium]